MQCAQGLSRDRLAAPTLPLESARTGPALCRRPVVRVEASGAPVIWSAWEHYKFGLEIRKTLYWLDSFKLEKPVKPTLQDDLILTRFGRSKGCPARVSAWRAAVARLRDEAERLLVKAESEIPLATLVYIQVYEAVPLDPLRVWVYRGFSNQSFTRVLEDRKFATQLKYTFEAGKKAGENSLDSP